MDNINRELVSVLSNICDRVATPRALAVKLLARSGEWTQLQQLRMDPLHYSDPEEFWADNLVSEFLRKQDIPTAVDKEAAAIKSFTDCERLCCVTNARFHRFCQDTLFIEDSDIGVYRFITEWRKDVKFVLGNIPTDLTPRFSGGATYDDIGKLINLPDKMSSVPTIYDTARCILPLWYDTAWHRVAHSKRYRNEPKTVNGNIFFTVPKDAEKRRGCGKEASIPLTYQLAVGALLKKRIKDNTGIDLAYADTVHKKIARSSSVDQKYATIDMSNASDTVARNLVKALLPTQWYTLLDSLRAHKTRVGRKWFNLEKFSSMGNGFTFELETIIFLTLARTVIREQGGDATDVYCFGDDLIVPSQYATDIMSVLSFSGFTANKRKTFIQGPFRESCGGDFFSGVPVRAHYVKELLDEPQKTIALMNGIKRVCTIDGSLDPRRWKHAATAWHMLLKTLPKAIAACKGPEHLGDIVIHDPRPEQWQRKKFTLEGCDFEPGSPTLVRCYRPIQKVLKWHHWTPEVQLASCTLAVESRGIIPRSEDCAYKLSWVIADRENQFLPTKPIR